MLDGLLESDFVDAQKLISDYNYGHDLNDVDEYAEYFAKVMKVICDYKVFKGMREKVVVFRNSGKFYEDREHRFIDLSLISFLHAIEAPMKFCEHNMRVRIRNMAVKLLTEYLLST